MADAPPFDAMPPITPTTFSSGNSLDNVSAVTSVRDSAGEFVITEAAHQWAALMGYHFAPAAPEFLQNLSTNVTGLMLVHPSISIRHGHVLVVPGESIGSLAARALRVFYD